jgi:hypothetical protein
MILDVNRRFDSGATRKSTTNVVRRLAVSAAVVALSLGGLGGDEAYAGEPTFALSSPDLVSATFGSKFILNGFGCTGSNVSPTLRWSNVPTGTKSLALQVSDLGCANRQRVLALDGLQHPGKRHGVAAGSRELSPRAAGPVVRGRQ